MGMIMSAHVVTGRARPLATGGVPLPLVALGEAVRRAIATRRAVEAGARPTTISWDALGPWRLIVDAPDSLQVADLHPAAVVLVEHAREELMATARVVLDLGGDVAAAADELHVHRTTLYYRLGQIHELTGIDLKAGAGRTDLQMALWLAAYRRTAGPERPNGVRPAGRAGSG
jgi:DNA-binding PucR family transcriptional regulator